ncbi:hypothetical protein [Microbacterium trichothecenolyticum]|uniref:Uncharacterized protein n=1 Tax=Microbacterium trichothecenolyticum TaxID=69370 RepID=A0A0M2HMB6_MICTR|nr:hypothetical protein [Microbacterium trichothecenolyticum]KJL45593.1 hypothetical protein RS82_00145 [Microbacterium trichothecenolyticum]
MSRWDELTHAEERARELRWNAHSGPQSAQRKAENAERDLARMEMGDDVDD